MIKRLLSGSTLRVFSTVLFAVIALFMMPFLIHTLGERNYGIWILVGSISGYYGLLNLGLLSTLDRFIAKEQKITGKNKVITTSFVLLTFMGLIVMLCAVIAGLVCKHVMSNPVEAQACYLMLITIGASLALSFPMRVFTGALTASLRYDVVVVSEMIKSLFRTGLIIYALLNGYGVVSLAYMTLVSEVIGIIIQYLYVRIKMSDIRIRRKYFCKIYVKDLLNYGWIASLSRIIEILKIKYVPLFVSLTIGIEAIVFYSVALRLMDYFQQIIQQAIGIMVPVFSRYEHNKDKIKMIFSYTATLTAIATLYIGGCIIIFGDSFIHLWIGEGFEKSYFIVLLMIVPYVASLIQIPSKELLFGLSKHKICMIIHAIEVVMSIFAGIIFTSFFGFYGIAIGFVIGVILPELILPLFVARELNIRAVDFYTKIIGLTSIKTLLVMSIFYEVISSYSTNSYFSFLITGILQFLVFLPIAYFFILPTEMRKTINNKLPRFEIKNYKLRRL